MKSKPFTMILILGLYAGGAIVWHDQSSYASEQEVATLTNQVKKVEYSVNKTALENRLANIETELFNIQQKVQEILRNKRIPDQIYDSRINSLSVEKERLQRELESLR